MHAIWVLIQRRDGALWKLPCSDACNTGKSDYPKFQGHRSIVQVCRTPRRTGRLMCSRSAARSVLPRLQLAGTVLKPLCPILEKRWPLWRQKWVSEIHKHLHPIAPVPMSGGHTKSDMMPLNGWPGIVHIGGISLHPTSCGLVFAPLFLISVSATIAIIGHLYQMVDSLCQHWQFGTSVVSYKKMCQRGRNPGEPCSMIWNRHWKIAALGQSLTHTHTIMCCSMSFVQYQTNVDCCCAKINVLRWPLILISDADNPLKGKFQLISLGEVTGVVSLAGVGSTGARWPVTFRWTIWAECNWWTLLVPVGAADQLGRTWDNLSLSLALSSHSVLSAEKETHHLFRALKKHVSKVGSCWAVFFWPLVLHMFCQLASQRKTFKTLKVVMLFLFSEIRCACSS